MNIIYTGRHEEFPPKFRTKVETKLQKIGKMLERRGEKEAHVILRQERFLHNVEITINAFDHALVCAGENADLETAVNTALEKLEKQVVKLRERWRDTKRHHAPRESDVAGQTTTPRQPRKPGAKPVEEEQSEVRIGTRVYRVTHADGSKPMTIEEAILEMEPKREYLVYRDAETERLSVLVRRKDGHFDLIES